MSNDKNGRNSGHVTKQVKLPTAKERAARAVKDGRRSFMGLFPTSLAETAKPAPDSGKKAPQTFGGKPEPFSAPPPTAEEDLNFGDFDSHSPSSLEADVFGKLPLSNGDIDNFFSNGVPHPEPSPEKEGFGPVPDEDSISRALERATEVGSQPPAAPAPETQAGPPLIRTKCSNTLPPPPMRTPHTDEESEGRRRAILPGSPPEPLQLIQAEPQPKPGGTVGKGTLRPGEDITERKFRKITSMSAAQRAADREGVSPKVLEETAASMDAKELRKNSMVEQNLAEFMLRIPERFKPSFEEAMGIILKKLEGNEPDVEKMIFERRWKYVREQQLLGSISAAADEIQWIFAKLHKKEAIHRTKQWKEPSGSTTPGDAIKDWAFTILSSKPPGNETREMNGFDAYAKAVTFLLLSKHRPRTFMYALGHPEISKPYGQLGGMEGLGVLAGLDLPDPKSTQVPNPIIGLAFRLSREAKYTTLIGWLQDLVAMQEKRPYGPEAYIVGRFGYFVEQEIRDFQQAVQDAGFSAETFFSLLNRKDLSKLRDDEDLNIIFEKSAKGPGRMIYHEPDDVFDAIEAIIGYMNLLKEHPQVRGKFLEHFLGSYPLREDGGSFYKMFNMSLFTDKEALEAHPYLVTAFRKDPDNKIRYYISEAIRRLHPRESIIGGSEEGVTDETDGDDGLDKIFAEIEGEDTI